MLKRTARLLREYFKALLVIIPIAFLVRSFGYGLYRVPSGSMEPTMLVGERFFADKFFINFHGPRRGDIITFNDPTYVYSPNSFLRFMQRYVWGPCNLTKRVIAVPGDHVQGTIEEGRPVLYLNAQRLVEPYVNNYPLVPISNECDIWRSYDPTLSFTAQPFYVLDEGAVKQAQKWCTRCGKDPVRYPQRPMHEEQGSDIFDVMLKDGQYWVMGDNRLGSSDSRDWGPLDSMYIHGRILYRLWSVDSNSNWWIVDFFLHPLDCWKMFRWKRVFQKI
jgi:signal peptidase I